MQLSFDEKGSLLEKTVLKLEDNGWHFRVTRWQDRETLLSYPGTKNHLTRVLHKTLRQNKRAVIEYLDRRAKMYIAICREQINSY